MDKTIQIKKGFDINILGEAERNISHLNSSLYAVKPTDFVGFLPKLFVKEGDQVKAGTPLFRNKFDERIMLTSPVSGTVEMIKRGEKRVLQEVIIKAGTSYDSEDFGKLNPASSSREKLIELLLKSGTWAMIRQRPYSTIANPDDTPRDFYISAFDTAPLAIDIPFVVSNNISDFQTGIDAMKLLAGKNIKLGLPASEQNLSKLKNVDITYYSGPHPAGNLSVHINKTQPINKGEKIWYIHPQDLIIIGRLCNNGFLDTTITIPVCGSEVPNPQYYTTRKGVSIEQIVSNIKSEKDLRCISGNVLTGTKIKNDGYLGFFENQFTIIPEGNEYEFFGWALPGADKVSFSRTFLSMFCPKKKRKVSANLHGGHRALVMTGIFENLFPLDIYPMQLIKACISDNLDLMEQLGIYEVDEEDFALLEFADPSKTEIQAIIRKGLNTVRKELE